MFWTGLTPEAARKSIADKDKSKRDKRCTLKDAVHTFIKNGDNVAIGGFVNIRQPIAICHEMIRHGFKDMTISFQSGGMAMDYLGGAMAIMPEHFSIRRIEFAYWAHESFGLSPIFRYLAERGKLELEDWSNYNMSARFKAGAMGLTFLPSRGPLGSDILQKCRAQVIECPFTQTPIVLVPASYPNVAVIHVQSADKYGNCIIRGTEATCPEMAMAAAHTIVTCEQIVPHEIIRRNPDAVTIPFFAVDAVVQVPYGAYPTSCGMYYYFNKEHIATFHALAKHLSKEDFKPLKAYYDEYILAAHNVGDFINKFPVQKILEEHHAELRNYEILL